MSTAITPAPGRDPRGAPPAQADDTAFCTLVAIVGRAAGTLGERRCWWTSGEELLQGYPHRPAVGTRTATQKGGCSGWGRLPDEDSNLEPTG